jgi:long-chain acyl-CoA synthetase
VYTLLENSANAYADQEALIFQDKRITYAQLKNAADRLAQGLISTGLKPGDRIAVMLPNIPHFPICYYASMKLALTIVPISICYKQAEIQHQVEDSEAKAIIYWGGFRNRVLKAVEGLDHCRRLLVVGNKEAPGEVRVNYLIEKNEPLSETFPVESGDTALVVYTAGTTGRPKGAELTHQNILANTESCLQFLQIDQNDSVVAVMPLYHPLGHTLCMATFLRAGGRIILLPKFNAGQLLELIANKKPSYLVAVPSMIREILKEKGGPDSSLASLKFVLSSGDALRPKTLENFEKLFKVPILEGYGLTEASPMVSFNSPKRERKAGSVGLPLPGVEMRIVDDEGEEVKPGEVGEIIVQGPNVMKGYLNRIEATKEVLRDGWLYTGDLAVLHENGFGFIVVRKKNVIVKSGFNVYPREVEKHLNLHPKVKEAVVVGVPDPLHGEEIHATVVLRSGETATEQEIIEYAKEHMATYKCPRIVHFMETLPKGPTGRVLRDDIKASLVTKEDQ